PKELSDTLAVIAGIAALQSGSAFPAPVMILSASDAPRAEDPADRELVSTIDQVDPATSARVRRIAALSGLVAGAVVSAAPAAVAWPCQRPRAAAPPAGAARAPAEQGAPAAPPPEPYTFEVPPSAAAPMPPPETEPPAGPQENPDSVAASSSAHPPSPPPSA